MNRCWLRGTVASAGHRETKSAYYAPCRACQLHSRFARVTFRSCVLSARAAWQNVGRRLGSARFAHDTGRRSVAGGKFTRVRGHQSRGERERERETSRDRGNRACGARQSVKVNRLAESIYRGKKRRHRRRREKERHMCVNTAREAKEAPLRPLARADNVDADDKAYQRNIECAATCPAYMLLHREG